MDFMLYPSRDPQIIDTMASQVRGVLYPGAWSSIPVSRLAHEGQRSGYGGSMRRFNVVYDTVCAYEMQSPAICHFEKRY